MIFEAAYGAQRSAPEAPPRPVQELERIRAAKLRELTDVQSELETAQWLQEYDQAEMYRPERR